MTVRPARHWSCRRSGGVRRARCLSISANDGCEDRVADIKLFINYLERREWDSNLVFVLPVNNLLILQNARIARNAAIANLRHV